MKPMSDTDGVNMSGLMIGCYPLEALLQSTLECFYKPHSDRYFVVNTKRFAAQWLNATIEEILADLLELYGGLTIVIGGVVVPLLI